MRVRVSLLCDKRSMRGLDRMDFPQASTRVGGDSHVGWKKVVYGGMQAGYADNYMDSSFLNAMVKNANVVKRDTATVMVDSVGIASHVSVVARHAPAGDAGGDISVTR